MKLSFLILYLSQEVTKEVIGIYSFQDSEGS